MSCRIVASKVEIREIEAGELETLVTIAKAAQPREFASVSGFVDWREQARDMVWLVAEDGETPAPPTRSRAGTRRGTAPSGPSSSRRSSVAPAPATSCSQPSRPGSPNAA